jgi:flagellar motor component MotA
MQILSLTLGAAMISTFLGLMLAYKFNDKCYTFKEDITKCDKKKRIVPFGT